MGKSSAMANLIYILVIVLVTKVDGFCSPSPRNQTQHVAVKETDSKGSILASFTSFDGEEFDYYVIYSLTSTREKNDKIRLDYLSMEVTNNTYYDLTLKKELDLELLNVILGVVNNFTVYVTCNPVSSEDESTETAVIVEIQPVNEFAPVFLNSPYTVIIPEDTANGSVVFNLYSKSHDEDVNSLSVLRFKLHKYSIKEFDGSGKFSIPNEEKGEVVLDNTVDYEQLKSSGMVFYMLNVSVMDAGGLHATTNINMTVADSDDLGPEFVYPGCNSPCEELALELVVHENYTGPLTLEQTPLYARDRDSINSTILYRFIPDADNLTDYFNIDEYTGELYQVKTLLDTNVSIIELTIQAKENTPIGRSIAANLTIMIYERATLDDKL